MSEVPEVLREAYVRDIIDLETFERFVTYFIEDVPCGLPQEVIALGRVLAERSDAPGQIMDYESELGTPRWFTEYATRVRGAFDA